MAKTTRALARVSFNSKYLLSLNAHPKIGSQTIKKALAVFDGDIERLWLSSSGEIKNKLDKKIADLIIEAKNSYHPQNEVEKLQKLNIGHISLFDKHTIFICFFNIRVFSK